MPKPRKFLPWIVPVAGLLSMELAVRLLAGPPEYFQGHPFDPTLGFTTIPGVYYTNCDARGSYPWTLNASGFRGPDLPERDEEPPAGTLRILFVGDSFLAGWNVREESLLPAAAQSALAARGIAAECFNVSCSGYGTGQELLLLRKYGERVRPRHVVLCLYVGNDIVDNSLDLSGMTTVSNGAWVRPYFVLDEDGELHPTSLHPWVAGLRCVSRVATLVDHRYFQWRYREQRRYVRPGYPLDAHERMVQGLLPSEALEVLREPRPGGEWERAWRTTEALLDAFQRETRALGAELLVAVIPHSFQVESGALFVQNDENMRAAGQPLLGELLDWNLPERKLGTHLRAGGIAHGLLVDPLRRDVLASGESCYLYNGHFNSRAHELAGALVADHLARMLSGECQPDPLPEGEPVDLLGRLWRTSSEFRLTEPFKDLLGYGWQNWGCDLFGAGPGWLMAEKGWLVLPRDGRRFLVRAFLPPDARVPASFRVSTPRGNLGPPIVVNAIGPFELSIDLDSALGETAWVPVLIEAEDPFATPWFAASGLVMVALEADG